MHSYLRRNSSYFRLSGKDRNQDPNGMCSKENVVSVSHVVSLSERLRINYTDLADYNEIGSVVLSWLCGLWLILRKGVNVHAS